MIDNHAESTAGWLLLIHQIPPKPDYLRVKVWRRLQALGAVAIKNSVYVLPKTETTQEDFQWVQREIAEVGGEAAICEARFIDGLDDDKVRSMFQSARNVDYDAIGEEARALLDEIQKLPDGSAHTGEIEARARRLRRRFTQTAGLDFFQAPSREYAESALAAVEMRVSPARRDSAESAPNLTAFKGCTWITRPNVGIDRIASAWLIRRFVDPAASFRFCPEGTKPAPREVRFDMFEAEFTHEGDKCTFEVLIQRFGLNDRALDQLAQVIHDIDLKDGKFARDEAAGLGRIIDGMIAREASDERRFAAGAEILENLYGAFGERGP